MGEYGMPIHDADVDEAHPPRAVQLYAVSQRRWSLMALSPAIGRMEQKEKAV
jgi:hypothetical protein